MVLFITIIRAAVSLIAAYILCTLVHELGHIICGLTNGWKLMLLIIGPVKIYRNSPGSKIHIAFEKNPVYWLGLGGTAPVKRSENDLEIWAKILLSGPAASIVLGLLMIPFLRSSDGLFAPAVCFVPIAMGISCLVPMKMKTGIVYNDGTRYRRLRSGGQEAAEEEAMFLLALQELLEPDSLYSAEMTDPLVASEDPDLKYYGLWHLLQNTVKQEQSDEKERLLKEMEALKEQVSPAMQAVCALE